jgi:hypothetical protein
MSQSRSRNGVGLRTGTEVPTFDRAPPRPAKRPAKGISDEAFDALVREWFDSPRSGNITIAVRIEANGLTVRIRDKATVAAMLRGEIAARRERREAAS